MINSSREGSGIVSVRRENLKSKCCKDEIKAAIERIEAS